MMTAMIKVAMARHQRYMRRMVRHEESAGQDGADDGVTTGQEAPPEEAVDDADDGDDAGEEAPPEEAVDGAHDGVAAGQEAPPEEAVYGADDGVAAGDRPSRRR